MVSHFGSAARPAFFRRWIPAAMVGVAVLAVTACEGREATETDHAAIAVMAPNPVEAGRYIVEIGGCNDCHTDGFMEVGTAIPESERLVGSVVGFRGPWGTTYPPNLRLSAQSMTEEQWVEMLTTRTGMPPMPWWSVNAMSDTDKRAVYQYLRHLGPAGEVRSAALPPGVEPLGPWMDFDLRNLDVMASASN